MKKIKCSDLIGYSCVVKTSLKFNNLWLTTKCFSIKNKHYIYLN